MEIKATHTASLNSSPILKLQDLLNKMDQSSFKAIINQKINSDTFLLNSKAGSFQLSSQLDLKLGDELLLKIQSKLNDLSLKLIQVHRPNLLTAKNTSTSQIALENISLNTKDHKGLVKNIPNTQSHFIAKILVSKQNDIQFKTLKGETFSLDKKLLNKVGSNLETQQHIIIQWKGPNKVDLQPISKEQLLHQVQRQLLPKQTQNTSTHQRLNQAAFKLFQSIKHELATSIKASTEQYNKPADSQVKQILVDNKTNQFNSINKASSSKTSLLDNLPFQLKKLMSGKEQTISSKSESPINNTIPATPSKHFDITLKSINQLKTDIQSLLKSHSLTIKTLNSDSIKNLLTQLDLISPSNQTKPNQTFVQKLSLIIQTIDQIMLSLKDAKPKTLNKQNDVELLSDFFKNSLQEARQSFEVSIHKILLQSASSKINQEINSTQLINTHIPLEVEKETKDVALKIKQRQKDSDTDEDTWEIQLSLEMGALGTISSKILLADNNQVSVLFWAELDKTKQLLENKKDIFKQQMMNAGFTLNNLNIFLGKINQQEDSIINNINKFIDINV